MIPNVKLHLNAYPLINKLVDKYKRMKEIYLYNTFWEGIDFFFCLVIRADSAVTWEKECCQCVQRGALTCGAVLAGPVGIAAACSGVCQERSVSRALVHAGRPGALTSRAAPSHKAVALSLDTHPSAWARRVQAVH